MDQSPAPNEERIRDYGEFWLYYLREHRQPLTRALHYFGTGFGLALALAGVLTGSWSVLPLALVSGYLFAWVGHFWVERNRPATFKYPLWSFASDFRMLGLWLVGKLQGELERAGIENA